jgi:hypothetical protein
MKLAHVMLIVACVVNGYAYAQSRTEQEDRLVARACKADAEHLCSGKTGEQMTQCLKSNQAQLSANCKDAVSKLPQQTPKT